MVKPDVTVSFAKATRNPKDARIMHMSWEAKKVPCDCDDEVTKIQQLEDRLDNLEPQFEYYKLELDKKWRDFHSHWNEVEAKHPAYKSAIATCALVDIATEVVIAGLSGSITMLETGEGVHAAILVFEMLKSASEGIEALKGSVEGMRGKLDECVGKVPTDLHKGAMDYVHGLETALEEMADVRNALMPAAGKKKEIEELEQQIKQLQADLEECVKKC